MAQFGIPLQRLYGPAWSGPHWDPGFKCCWTQEKDQSGHHCPEPECGGPIKSSCYRNLHVGFCCVVVKMRNGQFRFCGHRFQIESPKACALHHWGPNNENKFLQLAKKGLPFDLPPVFPHEQPGWEMVLSSYGSIRSEVAIRMGFSRGRESFVRVMSYDSDGQPDEVAELVNIHKNELLLGVGPPYPGTVVAPVETEEDSAATVIQALAQAEERDDVVYNDLKPWEKFNNFRTGHRATTAWAAEAEKQQKTAATGAATVAAKPGKKVGKNDRNALKKLMRGKKRN